MQQQSRRVSSETQALRDRTSTRRQSREGASDTTKLPPAPRDDQQKHPLLEGNDSARVKKTLLNLPKVRAGTTISLHQGPSCKCVEITSHPFRRFSPPSSRLLPFYFHRAVRARATGEARQERYSPLIHRTVAHRGEEGTCYSRQAEGAPRTGQRRALTCMFQHVAFNRCFSLPRPTVEHDAPHPCHECLLHSHNQSPSALRASGAGRLIRRHLSAPETSAVEEIESTSSPRRSRTSEPSVVGLLGRESASSKARPEPVPLLEDADEGEATLTSSATPRDAETTLTNSATPRDAVPSTDPVVPAGLTAASALPSRLSAAENVRM